MRGFAETKYREGSWTRSRRVDVWIDAASLGCDRRYVVTNIRAGTTEWLYDSLYCSRCQSENLTKFHKTQHASNQTNCRSSLASGVRLVLQTVAHWLISWSVTSFPKSRSLPRLTPERSSFCSGKSQPTSSKSEVGSKSPSPLHAPMPTRSAASRLQSSAPSVFDEGLRFCDQGLCDSFWHYMDTRVLAENHLKADGSSETDAKSA